MGFDLQSVPVRLDSAPLRALREDAETWLEASLNPPFGHSPLPGGPPAVSQEITELLPEGLDHGWHFGTRNHEQAEYLLDPPGFRSVRYSLPYRIVHGDQPFAEHARGGQGIRWRCSTSGFLADAAARIDAIDVAAARRAFSVTDMVDKYVYKAVQSSADDDEAFVDVLADLRRLARWYHRVVDAGLDLIVIVD